MNCIVCKRDTQGFYFNVPCCFECYRDGDLRIWLDAHPEQNPENKSKEWKEAFNKAHGLP